MNTSPHPTNVRSALVDTFYTLQTYARRDFLFAKLMGKDKKLTIFPEQVPHKSSNRKFIGMQDIPVEKIVGTLNRDSDFDDKFRPLKSHLRDRWVNAYLTLEQEGWAPILVHKVDDQYYVEDGHHRISVARSLGISSIQAKVWEYPTQNMRMKKCSSAPYAERSTVGAYAAD